MVLARRITAFGENPNAVMRLANTILAELVENRLTGRYP